MSDTKFEISLAEIYESEYEDKYGTKIACQCGRTINEGHSLLTYARDRRAFTIEEYEEYKQNGWDISVRIFRCPSCIKCSICQKELNSHEFYKMKRSGTHPDIVGKFDIFYTHVSCYEGIISESKKAREEYRQIITAQLDSPIIINKFKILNEAVKIREILQKSNCCIKCGKNLGLKEKFKKSLVCLPRKKFPSMQELPNMCYPFLNSYFKNNSSDYYDAKVRSITIHNFADFLKYKNTFDVNNLIQLTYEMLIFKTLKKP